MGPNRSTGIERSRPGNIGDQRDEAVGEVALRQPRENTSPRCQHESPVALRNSSALSDVHTDLRASLLACTVLMQSQAFDHFGTSIPAWWAVPASDSLRVIVQNPFSVAQRTCCQLCRCHNTRSRALSCRTGVAFRLYAHWLRPSSFRTQLLPHGYIQWPRQYCSFCSCSF